MLVCAASFTVSYKFSHSEIRTRLRPFLSYTVAHIPDTMADPNPSTKLEKFATMTNDIALRLYQQATLQKNSSSNVLLSPPALIVSLYQAYLASGNNPNAKKEFEEAIFKQPLSSVQDIIKEYATVLKNGQSTDAQQPARPYDFTGGSRLFLSGHSSNKTNIEEQLRKAGIADIAQAANSSDISQEINKLLSCPTFDEMPTSKLTAQLGSQNSGLLLSGAHFSADWEHMFLKKSQTSYEGRNRGPDVVELPASLEDFHNADGSVSQVVTVHLQGKIFLTRDESLKATIFELPMTQYEMNMVILLPDASKNDGEALTKLEKALKADTLDIMRRNWQMPNTRVYLPKFSFTGECSMMKELNSLGLKSIFSEKSDVNITDCIHAASMAVSVETGPVLPPREAQPGECSMMEVEEFAKGVHVNRPFLFIIRKRSPEIWCMMGRVTNLPNEEETRVWNHHRHQQVDQEF